LLELTIESLNGLRKLIETNETQDELECRKYLACIEDYLFKKDTLVNVVYSERETPVNAGKTDYIISGIIGNNPVIAECSRTYIWELKAPQYYLFRKDGENRLCPTKELFEAENQLLNYYHDLKYDLKLVARFKAGHPINVFVGGIIIGSKERTVKGDFEENKKSTLAGEAYAIRNEYFYRQNDLWLLTWTDVLNYFEQKVNEKFVNLTKENVIPDYTFKDYKPKAGTISTQETL
jgi:hypothetical protein